MKFIIPFLFFSGLAQYESAEPYSVKPGFEHRIIRYIDSLRVVDTHEHLFTPEVVNGGFFADLMLLFQQNGYDDLVSAVMPAKLFDTLYNEPLTPVEKWKIIEPYYRNAFNTAYIRVILYGINRLYGITDLNENTVAPLSEKIKETYSSDRFDRILRDSCKIDYVIQDAFHMQGKDDYFRYAQRFDQWINIKSRYTIDSLAMIQVDSISTLREYESSMERDFKEGVQNGMAVVKVALAYSRSLHFEKTERNAAQKVFRKLINGKMSRKITGEEAKPLQDYMMYRLLDIAGEYNIPVAFHTGLQAGKGNFLYNSDPLLLTNLFKDFPDVNFVLYHGSYPYGGQLAALAKTFRNVYIDMNWMYSISPSYSERYLHEWLETVPVNKLMAFGGDCMAVENVYSELRLAKSIIAKVLISKVREGYIGEDEAKLIAKMMLHDNAVQFYKLK